MNKVFLTGRLTEAVREGNKVANFNIAVDGYQESVDFFTITAFGNLGEHCAQYLVKGQQVTIEGSLHNNNYEDAEGVKHYSQQIIASNVEFGAKPKAEEKPAKKSYTRR